jgi:hypothetical protein
VKTVKEPKTEQVWETWNWSKSVEG